MHKLIIPIQHRGFPPEAQRAAWNLAGLIGVFALCIEPWKGGWYLFAWGAVSLLEGCSILRQVRRMVAPAQLGGRSLAGMASVSVEILREGEAVWSDPAGLPIDLTPEEGWEGWLALLSLHGFPAFTTASASSRLNLERASATAPMPRRHPDQAPDRRSPCDQVFPRPSRLPFRLLLAFFLCLLVGTVGMAALGDPLLSALGGGSVTVIAGLVLLLVWLDERRGIRSIQWDAQRRIWNLSSFSGIVTTRSPEARPMALKRVFGSGPWLPPPVPGQHAQPDALALFLDDQAHAAWKARRGPAVFTHSSLEQEES